MVPRDEGIADIFVDRESPPICRTEARWRLEGKKRKPRLVFWRETRDWQSNHGRVVVSGKSDRTQMKKGARAIAAPMPCRRGEPAFCGIAFGYRVKSQPAFPLGTSSTDLAAIAAAVPFGQSN
jgi:hypothetical protein